MSFSRSTPIMGVLALVLVLAVVPGLISRPGPIFTGPSRPVAPDLATVNGAIGSDGGSMFSGLLEVMPADPPPDEVSSNTDLKLRPQPRVRGAGGSLTTKQP